MHPLYRQHHGIHQLFGPFFRKGFPHPAHILRQGHPPHILHNQIGGAVFRHIVPVPCDGPCPGKPGEQIRFPAETAKSLPEIPSLFPGKGRYLFPLPFCQVGREKFLNGHGDFFLQIHGQVGDAKAAGTDPVSQQVPSRQDGKGGKLPQTFLSFFPEKAAVWTGPAFILPALHTVGAKAVCVDHSVFCLLSSVRTRPAALQEAPGRPNRKSHPLLHRARPPPGKTGYTGRRQRKRIPKYPSTYIP